MNVSKIQGLSKQCCALEIFKDRCTWDEVDFSVGSCLLPCDVSALIKTGIQGIVEAEIEKLQAEIIKVIEVEIKQLRIVEKTEADFP